MTDELTLVADGVRACTRCHLHSECRGPVPFDSPPSPDIVVLGEAPGKDEDAQNKPFVGAAGKLMRASLKERGIDPATVGFVNTVCCYPAAAPPAEAVKACGINRIAQIDVLKPRFLLIAGSVAMKAVRPDLGHIKHARRHPFQHDGMLAVVCYHPAAPLHQRRLEEDFAGDLDVFADLASRPEAWHGIGSETCVECLNDPWWFDVSGLGWCQVHMPPEGEARRDLLERELAGARARSS